MVLKHTIRRKTFQHFITVDMNSRVNYGHFTFMMEESMKLCTMPFYNVYIHEKLWGKGLLLSNPLFPPLKF